MGSSQVKKKDITEAKTFVSGDEELETKVTTLTKTIISGLLKYANYSVTLLAFTSAGDGVKSSPIFCKTDEDGRTVYVS